MAVAGCPVSCELASHADPVRQVPRHPKRRGLGGLAPFTVNIFSTDIYSRKHPPIPYRATQPQPGLDPTIFAGTEVVSPGTTHTPAPLEGEEDMALKGLTAGRWWIWDSDHFKRDITSIGTALRFKRPDDFISIGIIRNDFRQGDWSEHCSALPRSG
jgi:hypothetical protein